MNLLLLSLNPGAVPHFIAETVTAPAARVRIGYIDDASHGMPFAAQERSALESFGYELTTIHIRDTTPEELTETLATVDAVYAASGETFVLLEALQLTDTADILAQHVRNGLPYIGCSAGTIITGPSITPAELMDERSAAPQLISDAGLNLIDFTVIPHSDGNLPPYPPELIEQIKATYSDTYPLIFLDDSQALRVTGSGHTVISSL